MQTQNTTPSTFNFNDEKFADIQLLRYRVEGFEQLTLKQKTFIYHLTEAALWGHDILFDQNGRYNLRIRRLLEAVYTSPNVDRSTAAFAHLTTYLKQVWFASGIHHHYGAEKFVPQFTPEQLREMLQHVDSEQLPLEEGQDLQQLCQILFPVIFDPTVMPLRINQREGDDLLLTSASNYYGDDVTQAEAEAYYAQRKDPADPHPVMIGLNSRLVKQDGQLIEKTWTATGLYSAAIQHIIAALQKALPFAESQEQKAVIQRLIQFYQTGDLHTYDQYSILWLQNTADLIDFCNNFTETYGDPLGLKASWESIVNFKDLEATHRTTTLSENAQWFEDHSPADPRFKKEKVKGVSAKVITAAILAGDLYPASAIGINLPNSDWLRKEYGSKSVTIGNLTAAYSEAAKGSGMGEEFVIDADTLALIRQYGHLTDDLHTDLHECLGHGSGKLLPHTDPDALRAYGATIEEGRADLFGLYYIADPKLVELGLLPNMEAYKAQYYTYMQNGLLTQAVRIKLGNNIEEAHMRNRAFIAHWVLEQGAADQVVQLLQRNGKTYVQINDYEALRTLFGKLLAEVQRIKSEGDYEAARQLVENYGVKIDPQLHEEVLQRYARLHLAPYKGFINPKYEATTDADGHITDVKITYGEPYDVQMLRYSRDYRTLPHIND